MRISILLLFSMTTFLVTPRLPAQEASTVAFVNGRWFDGRSFQTRTVYSVNGVLRFAEPQASGRTIDLSGAWVVAPFAEAHNHNIDGAVEARALASLRQ